MATKFTDENTWQQRTPSATINSMNAHASSILYFRSSSASLGAAVTESSGTQQGSIKIKPE